MSDQNYQLIRCSNGGIGDPSHLHPDTSQVRAAALADTAAGCQLLLLR